MEDLIQERVAQKESELNATYDEKILNLEERSVHVSVLWTLLTCLLTANAILNAN